MDKASKAAIEDLSDNLKALIESFKKPPLSEADPTLRMHLFNTLLRMELSRVEMEIIHNTPRPPGEGTFVVPKARAKGSKLNQIEAIIKTPSGGFTTGKGGCNYG